MVSRALETEAELVEPVAGGRSEKKVREGYVVICKVWATVWRATMTRWTAVSGGVRQNRYFGPHLDMPRDRERLPPRPRCSFRERPVPTRRSVKPPA